MKIRRFAAVAVAGAAIVAGPAAFAASPAEAQGAACAPIETASLSGPSLFRYGVSGDRLQKDFFDPQTGLAGKGYRPVRIAGYRDGDAVRFATRWVKAAGPSWRARFGLTAAEFHQEFVSYRATHRMTDVSGYNTAKGVRFAVVWERNPSGSGWRVHRDVDRQSMQDLVDGYASKGLVPVRVEGYRNGSGDLRFVSLWASGQCTWKMHNKMSRDEYQRRLEEYKSSYRLVHLDATVEDGKTWFHGIWWKQAGPTQTVRSDRHWYLFQRFVNNNWCAGYRLTNAYATDAPGGPRFGGIWTYAAPISIGASSGLDERVREEVDCAPGRAGAAVIDLSSGAEILQHADQTFATSSTIKSAILYALLRKADAEEIDLDTARLNVGSQYGNNQNGALNPNQSYPLDTLARAMIDFSNNWATNRLVDYVGRDRVNDELAGLGLTRTRLNRYMIGTNAPSAHGQSGPVGDLQAGWDNVTTPREFTTFLRRVHENAGLLSAGSSSRFWTILALNGGDHDAILDAGIGTSWRNVMTLFLKGGNNSFTANPGDYAHRPQIGSYDERSEAGRMVFAGGRVVVYAAFGNEADAGADGALANMLNCIVVETVRDASGTTTGAGLSQCR